MSEVRGYLDELPSELQVLIAKHLDRYSIVSFRSTSHRLLAASHHVFVAEYFTTRVHLVSRYALRALVDICANPLWTAKLQQIELVFGDIYMPKPHEIDNTRLRGKGIVKIDREYDDLFHNNYHRRLLREMFAHLNRAKRRGVAITVGRTKEDDGGPVFGYEKLERLIGCRLDLGVGHPER
ncbi:unnamed protein product [Zymoseptoria tritici ST99CH_3D7]|uniref:F-box domain-containing protein n=1 Tax=Zymoseptoria tritici (strain ST99CH_3D7) TaxID=1276538 RepID=A0A1X7S0F9_ZYMT9|nr:unnamed protein product [Zymoseptoria tritici ST99CH_3D7]